MADILEALEVAIAKIAQKACRNGESDERTWPPLSTLPLLGSWRCVGDTYGGQVLAAIGATTIAENEALRTALAAAETRAANAERERDEARAERNACQALVIGDVSGPSLASLRSLLATAAAAEERGFWRGVCAAEAARYDAHREQMRPMAASDRIDFATMARLAAENSELRAAQLRRWAEEG